MGKIFFQFSVLAIIFLSAFYGLSRIDFMRHWRLAGISRKTENKIGGLVIDEIRKNNREIDDHSAAQALNAIKNRLCADNAIPADDITIHLVRSDEVNAFAIPGHHIIVYTGLISRCDSPSELCGVIAHEMGHIRLNHVMKRLLSEFGITLLASVASNGNSRAIGSIIKILSSTAFERKQENEADAIAVTYLQKANIDPRGFADFMTKMADLHAGAPKEMSWISSHPDSRERAATILALIDTMPRHYTPVIDEQAWSSLKQAAEDNQ